MDARGYIGVPHEISTLPFTHRRVTGLIAINNDELPSNGLNVVMTSMTNVKKSSDQSSNLFLTHRPYALSLPERWISALSDCSFLVPLCCGPVVKLRPAAVVQ